MALLDDDAKQRMLSLIKDATSSITLEDIIKERKGPNTNVSLKNAVETLGNVEGSVEALRSALLKLEEGCSTEKAKALCEPQLLNQMVKWKVIVGYYTVPFHLFSRSFY